MMGNLLDIQSQIEKLQKQAEDIRTREYDKTLQDIVLNDFAWYEQHGITLHAGKAVVREHEAEATMHDWPLERLQDVDTRAARLPSRATWTVPATMPAILIAQRLYGSPDRAPELVARNNIRNPTFVPAGLELEVLLD